VGSGSAERGKIDRGDKEGRVMIGVGKGREREKRERKEGEKR
jgi:hypothetical protein